MELHREVLSLKLPTWLQVGGPRGSKIEAEPRKNRCRKTTRFRDRFLGCPGMVFEGFFFLPQTVILKICSWFELE